MKVIIAGSRHMDDYFYPLIQEAVDASGFDVTEVVCGMAKGADLLGFKWATEKGIPVANFPANWAKFGRAAGPIRNKQMADHGDAAIVFIWQNSRGSANMIKTMEKQKKPVFVVKDGLIPK